MMRAFYKTHHDQSHRYRCRGDDGHVGAGLCIGIGGVGVDATIAGQLLEAVSTRNVGPLKPAHPWPPGAFKATPAPQSSFDSRRSASARMATSRSVSTISPVISA